MLTPMYTVVNLTFRSVLMSNVVGDVFVPLFFVAGSISTLFLAYKFVSEKAAVYRNFGLGLLFLGLAFAVWTVVVLTKPDNLENLTTIGAIPFAVSFLFFLMAGTTKLKASQKSLVMFGGLGYLAVLLLLRTFVYESHPSFSDKGLFYFHADPTIIALYIVGFATALLPAINAVSQQIKDKSLRFVTQTAFTTLAIGGIVLVTSYDDTLQTINGWFLGIAFLTLLAVYSTKKLK